jgi:CBS domain-containing protein
MQVDRVKRSEHGVIVDPVTLPPDTPAGEAVRLMDERNIGGVPITVNGRLVGILTRRDLRFLESKDRPVSESHDEGRIWSQHPKTRPSKRCRENSPAKQGRETAPRGR